MTTVDSVNQFRAALASRGLEPVEIVGDGTLQRCPVRDGKPGRKDGSYVLHLDGRPAGWIENHRDGLGCQNWAADVTSRKLTAAERALERERVAAQRQARAADLADRHNDAARRAARLWQRARPASNDHPYLQRKGVPAFGLRLLRDQLVIPARDTEGRLWTTEFISPDGSKKFLTGGRKRGCYFAIGRPAGVLCIAEGYATAASIYRATGHAVAVAFDAGNLAPVAQALRVKFPESRIIVCADDDRETPGNPGVANALAAARAVAGFLAVPRFEMSAA